MPPPRRRSTLEQYSLPSQAVFARRDDAPVVNLISRLFSNPFVSQRLEETLPHMRLCAGMPRVN